MKPLSEVMGKVLGTVASQTRSGGALKPIWVQVVGEVIAKHSAPVRLEGGTLVVRCDGVAWRQALLAEEASLLVKLRAALGESTVARLVFEGP